MAELMKDPALQPPINRLIRCRQTQKYFKDGDWTEDPLQASTFADEIEAVRACIEHGLMNIELVLRAQGASSDLFSTPIR
jgi:hypothetical protein